MTHSQINRKLTTVCVTSLQYFNGSMVGFYNSTSYFDDLTWAAAWLYKATRDPGYLSDAHSYYNEHLYGTVSIPLTVAQFLLYFKHTAGKCPANSHGKQAHHLFHLQPVNIGSS